MSDITRRDALTAAGMGACFLKFALGSRAFAQSSAKLPDYILRIDELTAALRGQIITDEEWRSGLDQLYAQISLIDLLKDIRFDELATKTGFAEKGVAARPTHFAQGVNGKRLAFWPKLIAVDKGRAIIPHGHTNMVSCHFTLSGRFHLRQYDQIAMSDQSVLVEPSVDRIAMPGDVSSIGERSDNVHWFIAEEPSHTLDIIVTGLDPEAEKTFDILNLDMDEALPQANGQLEVPRLGVSEAVAKYG